MSCTRTIKTRPSVMTTPVPRVCVQPYFQLLSANIFHPLTPSQGDMGVMIWRAGLIAVVGLCTHMGSGSLPWGLALSHPHTHTLSLSLDSDDESLEATIGVCALRVHKQRDNHACDSFPPGGESNLRLARGGGVVGGGGGERARGASELTMPLGWPQFHTKTSDMLDSTVVSHGLARCAVQLSTGVPPTTACCT